MRFSKKKNQLQGQNVMQEAIIGKTNRKIQLRVD